MKYFALLQNTNNNYILIYKVIIGNYCITSSGKYFINILDETTLNNIFFSIHKWGSNETLKKWILSTTGVLCRSEQLSFCIGFYCAGSLACFPLWSVDMLCVLIPSNLLSIWHSYSALRRLDQFRGWSIGTICSTHAIPMMINRKWVCPSFNFMFRFRFIYYVLSLNNSKFWWLYADRIYPIALEKRDTTDTAISTTYHGLHQEVDSDGRFKRKPYDKRDVFDFPILIFPCIYNNTPVAPTYLVHIDVIHLYIFQLITGPRACASYQHFLDRAAHYGRHHCLCHR